jgi:hypothetical protein
LRHVQDARQPGFIPSIPRPVFRRSPPQDGGSKFISAASQRGGVTADRPSTSTSPLWIALLRIAPNPPFEGISRRSRKIKRFSGSTMS